MSEIKQHLELNNGVVVDVEDPWFRASSGIAGEIRDERMRQINQHGFTPEHDDASNQNGELAWAAVCYVVPSPGTWELVARLWPWSRRWWKPKNRRENLMRAAALLVAEIERIDRAAKDLDVTTLGTPPDQVRKLMPDGTTVAVPREPDPDVEQ